MTDTAKPTFHFTYSCEVSLGVDEIWPDGDAPDSPTIADVAKLVDLCGGADRVLRDWDLDNGLEMTISDNEGNHTRVRR
jgi:hypothetical protein